jgi:hypothetical protein
MSEQKWDELKQIVQNSTETTAQSMASGNEDAKRHVQQLSLVQSLSTTELRLANIQAEIRALQRNTDKKASKTTRSQISALMKEASDLNVQRLQLQGALAALEPVRATLNSPSALDKSAFAKNNSVSCLGCLGWSALWLTLFMLIGALLINAAGEAGMLLGFILSTGIVLYIYSRRRKKAVTG